MKFFYLVSRIFYHQITYKAILFFQEHLNLLLTYMDPERKRVHAFKHLEWKSDNDENGNNFFRFTCLIQWSDPLHWPRLGEPKYEVTKSSYCEHMLWIVRLFSPSFWKDIHRRIGVLDSWVKTGPETGQATGVSLTATPEKACFTCCV